MTSGAGRTARFAADLAALFPPADIVNRSGPTLGLAVSGGPDSLALLVLAAAARPGEIAVASVDHRLREGSQAECEMVAGLCARLGVPHAILNVSWGDSSPSSNVQSLARAERYRLLAQWAEAGGLRAVATAHHADDQAETLLMRFARGSGVTGLSAIRPTRPLSATVSLIRPLLGWRREELGQTVADAGLAPVLDPANDDPRHDRTAVRRLLASTGWLDPSRLAATAHRLAEADEALEWALAALAAKRLRTDLAHDERCVTIDPSGLPAEFQRRLLLMGFACFDKAAPRGPELQRALAALRSGDRITLGSLKLEGGSVWRLSPAPRRRR